MEAKAKAHGWHNAVSASVRGASHEGSNSCCQDAVSLKEGFFRGEPYLIASTADGHGHPDYTHSERGAALAALAAEQTALQFMLAWDESVEDPGRFFAHYFRAHLKEEWLKGIAQSCSAYRADRELARKHGTTLLAVLVFRERVFMAQLGDGEICLLDKKGEASFLAEPEAGPVGSATWSLCSDRLDGLWRFACTGVEDVSFLMLSSDGMINSLESREEYVKLAGAMKDYLGHFPTEEVGKALPQWLADYSKRGSKDDISLVAINMEPDNKETDKGEQHENEHQDSGTGNPHETGGRRTGGSLPCQAGRKGLRAKAVQRAKRNSGPKSHHQASGRLRRARGRMRR